MNTINLFKRFAELRKATISFVRSVRPSVPTEQLGSQWTESHYILYLSNFDNLSRKFKFHYNLTGITGTSHEDQCTFVAAYRLILRRKKNLTKGVEKIKTHILCSTTFFRIS